MNGEKETSECLSDRPDVDVALTTESDAALRPAETQLQTIISKFAPEYTRLIGEMRRSLRGRLPTACEVVYEYKDFLVISYSPDERGYEGALAIRASATGVKLYFNRGADLPDPEKVLQGSGKQTRSIDVEEASTLAYPAVERLIEEAIARNPVPFARAGSGAIVFRSASAKRSAPSRPAR